MYRHPSCIDIPRVQTSLMYRHPSFINIPYELLTEVKLFTAVATAYTGSERSEIAPPPSPSSWRTTSLPTYKNNENKYQ